MGNCCDAETPCASVEEKSGLLAGKTAAPPETGIEGAFPDSPTSQKGRKVSMDEMKKEQIKAEEKMSVTEQGEKTPSMPQENGGIQKESRCTEAVGPPPQHQSSPVRPQDPQLQPPPAAEADVVAMAMPEKQTTALAEEKCPPLSTSQEVPDAHCDITSPVADPVGEGEWRNCLLPHTPGGSSPQKISNTESLSPPQSPTSRASERGSSSTDLQVGSLEPQGRGEGPADSAVNKVCPMEQDCGEAPLSQTVHDISLGPDSTGPTCDMRSEVLDPEPCPVDSSPRDPAPMEVDEAECHSDPPTELRDPTTELRDPPTELRDHPTELRAPPTELGDPPTDVGDLPTELSSLEGRVLSDPRPLRVNQDDDQAVWKGGSKEEETTGQVIRDQGASIEETETRVGGEGEETPAAAAAGDDEEEEMDVEMKEKTGEEEEEEEEEKKGKKGKEGVLLVGQVDESDEDIYTAKEDMYSSPSSSEVTPLKVEESCSLAPMVDLLSYSQREWRGNTTKSALIRKGYQQMMEWFGGVRRVRGDNYCALRATLFQVLSQTTQSPAWLHQDHFTMLPEELDGPDGLLSQWSFPGECPSGDGQRDATQQLKGYIELLRKTWAAAADCPTAEERRRLCEGVFQGGQEELGLMEALKLLMLGRAAELHRAMERGQDVPVFCWLLFARDTSPCPRTFLTNHLRQVGVSGGLEQVEMFLLGYALRCTIQVYRLYMSGTEEFLTYYPDDHRNDWPAISLVTEDDRHYNVPVVTATTAPEAASR